MICLDYVLWTSIDLLKEHGFTLKKARLYPAETITDADDIALPANTPTRAEFLLNSMKQEIGGIGTHVNADKTEYMCFNQRGDISTQNGGSLKLVDKFTYLKCSVSSTKNDINMCLKKVWTAMKRLLILWKSNLSDKIRYNFFQAADVSPLMHYMDADWEKA